MFSKSQKWLTNKKKVSEVLKYGFLDNGSQKQLESALLVEFLHGLAIF